MIQGNQAWRMALGQNVKQPLYEVEIVDFGIAITNFTAEQQPVSSDTSVSGYGVMIYGLNLYGT
jgi:hypothetical protein